ncbi:MAG: MMPL family transporter [Opitutales bacterium]|nr:MMPL family transporter [Opitutales bacterium]
MKIALKIVDFICEYRRLSFLILVSIVTLLVIIGTRTKFVENIYDILPIQDDVVESHLWAGKAFSKTNTLFFALAKNSEKSFEYASEFASLLKNVNGIKNVVCNVGADVDYAEMLQMLPFLFDEHFENLLKYNISKEKLVERFTKIKRDIAQNDFITKLLFKTDPLGVLQYFAPKFRKTLCTEKVLVENFKIITPDGKSILILATGDFDCANSTASKGLIERIDNVIAIMKNKYPDFNVAYAGGYRISAENARIAKRDSTYTLLLTLALMCIICFMSFRNRKLAFMALVPSMIGTSAAFCFSSLLFKEVSSISIAFASIAIGASIDYAVHILSFADLKRGNFSRNDAHIVLQRFARPICIVSGTTAMAFIIMACVGSNGFLQLGLFGVVGIIVAAIASVVLLPAFLVGVKLSNKNKSTIVERISVYVANFSTSKYSIIVAIFMSIVALFFIGKVSFNGDLSTFNALENEVKKDDLYLRQTWKSVLSSKSVLLRATSLEDVLQKNSLLRSFLARYNGVDEFGAQILLNSKIEVEANVKRWNEFWNSNVKTQIESACKVSGIKSSAVLKSIDNTIKRDFVFDKSMYETKMLKKIFGECLYIGDDICAISAQFNTDENFSADDFINALSNDVDGASLIDPSYLGNHIAKISFKWLFLFAIVAFVAVSVYLYFVMSEGVSGVVTVMISLVIGLFWAFGLIGAFGVQINVINSIFVIFAVCMAQDYAVFILNAINNKRLLNVAFIPILISSTTTIVAFAVLCISNHPVINGLGATSAISILSILFASICITPRIVRALKKDG